MPQVLWAVMCLVLLIAVWRLKRVNSVLASQLEAAQRQGKILEKQLAEAIEKLAAHESDKPISVGLFQKAVEALVALGVPGLVLLVEVSSSGFVGAAALTSALAALGGPFGMLGGIGVLLSLVIVSKALTQFGLPKMAEAVIRGLMAKGESAESIRKKINSIPKWVVTDDLRAKILEVLEPDVHAPAA